MDAPPFPRPIVANCNPSQQSRMRERSAVTEKEGTARVALERIADRALTDEEWETERSRLLEFARLLASWKRQSTAAGGTLPEAA